jgi:retron-type reverse transcriptase
MAPPWRSRLREGPNGAKGPNGPVNVTFSEFSYGFRPGRSAAQALHRCRTYREQGYRYVVDIDLAKFFDRVPQDRLMSRLATRVTNKRVLRLIRRFLRSGVMIDGLASPTEEGTPQGGPLSPVLSNIVLDELDTAQRAEAAWNAVERRQRSVAEWQHPGGRA